MRIARGMRIATVLCGVLIVLSLVAANHTPAPAESAQQQVTVYSSMPLQGAGRLQSYAVVQGARLALEEAGRRAGPHPIRYISLDNSTARAGTWTPEQTLANIRLVARDRSAVAYIGEFNSGASAISIPILNELPIAMISPSNTAVGLTQVDDDLLDRREMDRVEAPELAQDSRHRFGELRKKRQKSVKIPSSRILCCKGREIRIAVETIRPHRHRQERLSRREHCRPRFYRARVIDKESPTHLADMPRTYAAESELSNGRMDPVGSDNQVVRARRIISERDVDLIILLTQR